MLGSIIVPNNYRTSNGKWRFFFTGSVLGKFRVLRSISSAPGASGPLQVGAGWREDFAWDNSEAAVEEEQAEGELEEDEGDEPGEGAIHEAVAVQADA